MGSEKLTGNEIRDLLAEAICDIGYWSWWAARLPDFIQLEFGGTQLYFPPAAENQPPRTKIAVRMVKPKSIAFMTRREIQGEAAANWFNDLHHDKMEPPTCSYDAFTFTDKEMISDIIQEAKSMHVLHGYTPTESDFLKENCTLVFWAGDYGCAVAAEEMALYNYDGEVPVEDVPAMHKAWWDYWKKYWELRGTPNALPKDYACEVTIPVNNK